MTNGLMTYSSELITRLATERLAAVNKANKLEIDLVESEEENDELHLQLQEARSELTAECLAYFNLQQSVDRVAKTIAKHADEIPRDVLDDLLSALANVPDDSDSPDVPQQDVIPSHSVV